MPNPLNAPEITVKEVAAKLDANEDFVFIDCREPHEFDLAKIDRGEIMVPLQTLAKDGPSAMPESATKDAEIVVSCRSGGRSAQVTMWLLQNGWTNVKSMDGGILLWADLIDDSISKY